MFGSTMSARPLVMWEGDSRPFVTCQRFPVSRRWTPASVIGEDLAGDVWVGLKDRIALQNGRFTTFAAADGVPPGTITIYVDHVGRLVHISAKSWSALINLAARASRFVHFYDG
jgi:hypothetical protein